MGLQKLSWTASEPPHQIFKVLLIHVFSILQQNLMFFLTWAIKHVKRTVFFAKLSWAKFFVSAGGPAVMPRVAQDLLSGRWVPTLEISGVEVDYISKELEVVRDASKEHTGLTKSKIRKKRHKHICLSSYVLFLTA